MKRFLSLIIIAFFAPQTAFAQSLPETPTARFTIEELNNYAIRLLREVRNEEAYQIAKQAYERSQQREFRRRASRAANLIGIAAFRLGRISEAIDYYKQAFNVIADDREDPEVNKAQIVSLNRATMLLRLSGRYEDAMWCFNQALRLVRKQNDRAGESLILSRLSAVYSFTGDTERAAEYSAEALKIAKFLGD